MSVNLLSVENLSKAYGIKPLFDQVSFGIQQGERVALVAQNGSGKTTLLKILQNKEIPDSGDFSFRKGIRVGFLDQEPEFNHELNVYDSLFDSSNEILTAVGNYENALHNFQLNPGSAEQEKLDKAMEKMEALAAWDLEAKLKQILQKLNITQLNQKVGSLSGGERRRLALAQLLINEPELLIMDEPTNHLDIEMIEWLEAYFDRNAISLLLVTHDRYFLDHVCHTILELSPLGLHKYEGNYEYYIEKKAERQAQQLSEREKAVNLYKKELEWVRRQPKARGTKSKSRLEAFEQLKEKTKLRQTQQAPDLDFKMNRIGGKILELKKISKSYNEKNIIDHFDYTFKKGERIGVVGKNGSGKSTFLNILTGAIQPDAGKVVHGDTLVLGYYTQSGLSFKPGKRVIEVVRDVGDAIPMANGRNLNASQLLKMFGFAPEVQHDFVEKLSGGEKKRLYLLTVLMKTPNFLILDEPTNDLDLVTLQALEDYLQHFPGCLIIVSHDRYFMDKLVDQLLVFEGDGKLNGFVGTYTEYRALQEEEAKEQKEIKANKAKANAPKANDNPKKMSFNQKFELEQLDKEIPQLEQQKEELLKALNNNAADHEKLLQLGQELEKVQAELEEKEMRWLELSELDQ